MPSFYDLFQDAHRRAERDWKRNFIIPYGNAYSNAHTSFKKVLKEQDDADKKTREQNMALAMFALSFVGGSILTSVFGSAATKDAVASVAVDFICKNEMEKAFNAAHFIAGNKTAQFALGKLWDEAGSRISKELQNSLKEEQTNFPSIKKFLEQPLNLQNNLEKWMLDASDKVDKAASEITNKMYLTEAGQQEELKELMQSAFFRGAPKHARDEGPLRLDMELTLFMKHILDLDYLEKGYYRVTGRDSGKLWERDVHSRKSIEEMPGSPKYPTNTSKPSHISHDYQTVRYQQLGDIIVSHIDKLHKARFKEEFFNVIDRPWPISDGPEKISNKVLQKALETLSKLSDANLAKVRNIGEF